MKANLKERRRLPRIKRRARVSFVINGFKQEGLIVNFSEMGLYILSKNSPQLGDEISIPLDITADRKLELLGRIVWVKNHVQSTEPYDYGFGVELHAVPPEYIAFVVRMYDQLSNRTQKTAERFDVYHRVKYQSKDEFLTEYMENISRGGMYMATKTPIEPGSLIQAEIEIAGIGEPIQIQGRVAYRLEDEEAYKVGRTEGVGVQFVNLSPEAKSKIDHYIRRLETHRMNPKRRNVDKIPNEGSLTNYIVPEILIQLFHEQATGILLLERQNVTKLIYFKHGQPVYVESNLNTETLGRYLVRQGSISSKDLEDSLEELARGDAHHGEIMIRGGMLDRTALMEALVGHQEEKIMNTFLWFDGTFVFEPTQDWPKSISILPLRPYHILFNGISTWYDVNLIHAWMGLSEKTKIQLSAYDNIRFELPALAKKAMLHMYSAIGLGTLSKQLSQPLQELIPWVFGFVICGWINLDFSDVKDQKKVARAIPATKDTSPSEAISILHRWLNEDFNRLKNLNYFDLFGVNAESSDRELTKAYMKLMSRYSSKEITDIEDESFKKKISLILSWIQLGYDTLRDSHLRQMYLTEKQTAKSAPSDKLIRIEVERTLLKSIHALEKGNVADAVTLLAEAVARYPDFIHLSGYHGWALFLYDPKNNFKKAVQLLDEAIGKDPSDAYLHYFRGELFVYASEFAKAESCFHKALKLYPKFLKAQAALELVQEKLNA